jgi:AICAR transformylase/IMP cyclohydrolase PurH
LVGETHEKDYSNLEELKQIDINVHNSLKFMRDNSLAQYEEIIEQYFTTDQTTNMADVLNEGKNTIDLIRGGSTIRVNDNNKADFIKKKSR